MMQRVFWLPFVSAMARANSSATASDTTCLVTEKKTPCCCCCWLLPVVVLGLSIRCCASALSCVRWLATAAADADEALTPSASGKVETETGVLLLLPLGRCC